MIKPSLFSLLLSMAAISACASAEEPAPVKVAPLPDTYIADYARRLQTEMQQIQAQYMFDQQALQELVKHQEAAKPKAAVPSKPDGGDKEQK